jgi:NAD(P)-dependent dehydrogenase (short-subunit alcohol dehydrogenase family)
MNEKICLTPGVNSGIGKVTAKALAAGGATVIMVCRCRLGCAPAQAKRK